MFIKKLKGDAAAMPPLPALKSVAIAAAGAMLAVAVVAGMGSGTGILLVLGSFGASCVLLFGYPDVPFSQPRNVVFGHLLCSATGLVVLGVAGNHWWALALAVGFSIAAMMLTRTVHPPAGSNPVIVFLAQPGWSFLLFPTLAGALLLVAVALLFNNATRQANYPKYW